MALNLDKNREALITAWKEVLDDKSDINWALLGYDGQTSDLNLVAKGDGGLEELAEEFNSGKIQYALARVKVPEKNVEKIALINWQGEGAPLSRKGMCANHISTVRSFFKGIHVTMNARTDEEVDPDLIIQNVSKAVAGDGVKMSSNMDNDIPVGPVGTCYKKTNPRDEINSSAKDEFWKKEEQEEERRKREEQNKLRKFSQNEVKLLRRESEDYFNKEEALVPAPAQNKISPTPPTQQINGNSNGRQIMNGNGSMNGSSPKEISAASAAAVKASTPLRNNTSSDLVRQRIKSFDNGSSAPAGGMNGSKVNGSGGDGESLSVSKRRQLFESGGASNTTSTVVRRNPSLEIKEAQKKGDDPSANKKEVVTTTSNVPSTNSNTNGVNGVGIPKEEKISIVGCGIQRSISPQAPAATIIEPVMNKAVSNRQSDSPARSPVPTPASPAMRQSPLPPSPQPQPQGGGVAPPPGFEDPDGLDSGDTETITIEITPEMGLCARALYDYQAGDDTEITFDPGEIITNIERIDEGWWEGLGPKGVFGLFPANYVELLN